jgi:hypothetical protein
MTAKGLLDIVRDIAGSYGVEIRLSDRLIYRSVQYSVDEMYRRIMPKRPEWFEKTAVLNDGSAMPSDFVSIVDVFSTIGGVLTGFRYATVPDIPALKNNTAAIADATEPAYARWGAAMHTIPAATNGFTLVYNGKPTQFYTPTATIAAMAATVVVMPEDTFRLIARGAFERISVMLVPETDALEITQASLERIQKDNQQLYLEQLQRLLENSRGGIDVSVR